MQFISRCNLCGYNRSFKVGLRGRFNSRVNTVVCLRCGLVFEKLQMDENERKEFYSSKYHSIYSKTNVPDADMGEKKSLERLAVLQKYVRIENKKILEVGCANGIFLKLCEENGAQVLGIEPSDNYAKFAKEQFGLHIFTGTIETYRNSDYRSENMFDIICLFHVLEHVSDPNFELQWFHKKLSSNGLLYLEVPNIFTLWRWFNQSPRKFLRPVHLFNFTWATCNSFLKQNRFRVIAEDRKVPRRIRIIAAKSNLEDGDKCETNNPFFIILFFYLWPFIYSITKVIRVTLAKTKRLIQF